MLVSPITLTLALPALAGFTGTGVCLPSVGRGPGSDASRWYTCVRVHDPGFAPANAQLCLLLRNQANPSAEVFSDTIPAGDTKRNDNAIAARWRGRQCRAAAVGTSPVSRPAAGGRATPRRERVA
ncbi:MAG: hypothetical protein KA072_00715 [Thermoanaerobaculaceae bacterium]|nr:hypothetical protein [Thermoanaerobaculaceae bacterium]MDI9621227.1 hypothetical protein [Acidobacteriota bacterium]NLH11595.1 hypothetical protein [Holophagae bacterium]HPW56391.1 hypothetical protein [Thermoanaerobaculaceae bacterium]